MSERYDGIIVGGGAAGMMAAYAAGGTGKKILLLEQNDRLGKKLLITGKGRCNVTNHSSVEEHFAHIPVNPKFLYAAYHAFSPEDTIAFFEARGVPLKTERGKRVFPVSDRAKDIADAMIRTVKEAGVLVKTAKVCHLIIEDQQVQGVETDQGNFYGEKVLLCCGGKSYPLTGSDGSGYRLAEEAGHTVVPLVPSLIPILTKESDPKEMQGLSLRNVTLTAKHGKKVLFSELGEMLFTHFGVSGPLVLSASAHLKRLPLEGCVLQIDLKPGLSEEKLNARMLRDLDENKNKNIDHILPLLLPRKMVPVMLRRCGIPFDTKGNALTKEERMALLRNIKCFSLTPLGFRPIEEAIVTSGGVSVKEINPRNLESKRVRGLYFAGEIIDVDGYTGGFNLQIAFSTGYLAGKSLGE